MKNSLMYKMSYYRFAELFGGHPATDRVRGQQLPTTGPTLDVLGKCPMLPAYRADVCRRGVHV